MVVRDIRDIAGGEMTARLRRLEEAVESSLRGKSDVVRMAVICVLARGHLLIEDVPGIGKTTLAHALARAADCDWRRVQFTSDLLPSDVLGLTVFDARTAQFEFRPGPIFTNFLLADEINRTTPKTQSALLEAMNERQVSIDGRSMALPEPFMVIATQNPADYHGTYPLPESQLDRFLMRIRIGYPDTSAEREIVRQSAAPEVDRAVMSRSELEEAQSAVTRVAVDDAIVDYLLAIVEKTRRHSALGLGVSPRGSQALYRAAQASALADGRPFTIPDDVKRLAPAVLGHRVQPSGTISGERVIEDILGGIPVPL